MEEIIYHVSKSQEGQYIPILLNVDDIERLDVHYSYPRYQTISAPEGDRIEEVAIIDFSMIGPLGQYLGSSGSNRTHLYFSERESSVGFHSLKQMHGQWTLLLGAYKVPEEGVQVTYQFEVKEKTKRWYRGDLHMHTQASDGQLRAETLVELAKEMELDFIALTDHNNYHPEADYITDETITLIPGVEWTQYRGHGNFLNLTEALKESFVTVSDTEVEEMVELAHQKDALFVINHPFCPHVPWTWSLELDFDALEIINGGTDPRANIKAIEWWHHQLVSGRLIPIVGGSDFHRFDQVHSLASPTTHLFAKSKGKDDLLRAIKEGAAYVTIDLNGPRLDIESSEGFSLGDNLPESATVTLVLSQMKAGYFIKIISNKDIEEFKILEDVAEWRYTLSAKDYDFIRFEVWNENSLIHFNGMEGILLLVSNPLYFDRARE